MNRRAAYKLILAPTRANNATLEALDYCDAQRSELNEVIHPMLDVDACDLFIGFV